MSRFGRRLERMDREVKEVISEEERLRREREHLEALRKYDMLMDDLFADDYGPYPDSERPIDGIEQPMSDAEALAKYDALFN